MSRYEHLSIYRACYDFSREVYRIKLKLPQALRHDLGSHVFVSSLRCIRCVIFANGAQRKMRPLQELLLEIESLRTLTRLMHDIRGISKGEFQVLSTNLREIAKQANAWHAWERDRIKRKGDDSQPANPEGNRLVERHREWLLDGEAQLLGIPKDVRKPAKPSGGAHEN